MQNMLCLCPVLCCAVLYPILCVGMHMLVIMCIVPAPYCDQASIVHMRLMTEHELYQYVHTFMNAKLELLQLADDKYDCCCLCDYLFCGCFGFSCLPLYQQLCCWRCYADEVILLPVDRFPTHASVQQLTYELLQKKP